MGKCRYLAVDYEAEYVSKSKRVLERLMVESRAQVLSPNSAENSSFLYRQPWLVGKRESDISINGSISENLKKLAGIHGQEKTEYESIISKKKQDIDEKLLDFTAISPQNINGISSNLQLENLLPIDYIKKGLPSTHRLLHKHGPLLLSDPSKEVKIGYQAMEHLDLMKNESESQSPSMYDKSCLSGLEGYIADQDLFIDSSSIEVDETFTAEQKLPELEKEETLTFAVETILSMDISKGLSKEIASLAKCGGICSLEKVPSEPEKEQYDLDLATSVNPERTQVIELEDLEFTPFAKAHDEGLNLDLKKLDIPETLSCDVQKLVKLVGNVEFERCDTANVGSLLLTETDIKSCRLRGNGGDEAVLRIHDSCKEPQLSTIDEEIGLSWSITKHLGIAATSLQSQEKLKFPQVEEILMKEAQFTCVMEGEEFYPEIFETMVIVQEDISPNNAGPSSIGEVSNQSYVPSPGPSVTSTKSCPQESKSIESKTRKRGLNDAQPFVPVKRKITETRHNITIGAENVLPLERFLKLRGLSRAQEKAVERITPKIPSKLVKDNAAEESKNALLTIKSDILIKPKPVERNYREVFVHVTGGVLKMVIELDEFIKPVYEELKSLGTVPRNSDARSLDEEKSKYLLREDKKFIQMSGIAITKHPEYFVLVILHSFIVCKTRLMNLSMRSALGFLAEFYNSNKRMLESLARCHSSNLGSLVAGLPLAISSLKQSLNKLDLIHPKINAVIRIVSERFSKDTERGAPMTKILVLCTTHCQYLFEELEGMLNNLNCNGFKNDTVKAVGLALPMKERFSDDVLSEAIKRGSNVVILSTNFLSPSFPWKSFSLLIEYEAQPNSPWKDISEENRIRHIALMMERSCTPLHLSSDADRVVENDDSTAIIGSAAITTCGKLLHLLETRYNITILEREFESHGRIDMYGEEQDLGVSMSEQQPDLILDEATCVIVEKFSCLNGTENSDDMHRISLRILDLQLKFTKIYLIISNLNAKNSSYPLKGNFPLNLAKLHTFMNNFLTSPPTFEMTIYCLFDLEHVAKLIDQLLKKCRDRTLNSSFRMSTSASNHERFLTRFPSINALVAQKMLSVSNLKEISAMSLSELKRRFAEVPDHCLEDFHHKLHERCIDELDTPESMVCSDVDMTPDFSLHFGDDEVEPTKAEDNSSFASQFAENCCHRAVQNSHGASSDIFIPKIHLHDDKKSSSVSNPCRKRLRFERIKEWKDGQTRLTFS